MSAINPSLLSIGSSSSPQTHNNNSATPNTNSDNHDDKDHDSDDFGATDEQQHRDRALADILSKLDDDYRPIVPDELIDYYLQRSGFETNDTRLKRLLGLAAQKFVSDIATDAFQYARTRTNTSASGRGRPAGPDSQTRKDRGKVVLTMEDLSAALAEHGVNASRRPYYL